MKQEIDSPQKNVAQGRKIIRRCAWTWLLIFLGPCVLLGAGTNSPCPSTNQLVRIVAAPQGTAVHFYVENRQSAPVTVTLDVTLTNLVSRVALPHTKSYPASSTTPAFSLNAINPRTIWSFAYTNSARLGDFNARHDDKVVYALPYAPSNSFRVLQGYGGRHSHTGDDHYSLDFRMPEGTPVHAARGGVIVHLQDDSDQGGPTPDYDACANVVMVLHDDGTIAQYAHLQRGGAKVKLGQKVTTGQFIALSGNTGYSSGPHLHFSVFRPRNGRERETIPTPFRTRTDERILLRAGRRYAAP